MVHDFWWYVDHGHLDTMRLRTRLLDLKGSHVGTEDGVCVFDVPCGDRVIAYTIIADDGSKISRTRSLNDVIKSALYLSTLVIVN